MNLFTILLGISLTNAFHLTSPFQLTIPKLVNPRNGNIKMNYLPQQLIQTLGKGQIGNEWTYEDFVSNIKGHMIDSATVTDNGRIFLIDKQYTDSPDLFNIHLLKTLPSLTDNVITKLTENHINFDVLNMADLPKSIQIPFFVQFLGFYILGNLALNFLAQRGGGGMNMMNPMQQLKKEPDYVKPEDIDVTFADVAGCDETKYELMEVVDFLKNPMKFEASGAKIPKGILLEGSPGTGKTLLARAVAGEAGVSFIQASGSQFIEMFVGVGAARVRSLFEAAEKASPCVIFIDEIDAVGRQRGTGFNSGNDEREQTLNQLLTNMDGFTKSTGIIVLAATNRADILDSALTRPGRFDRSVAVPLPDPSGRLKIFDVHLKDKFVAPELELDEFKDLTSGFSGADIANMVNEAAILSVRSNNTLITRDNLMDAFEKVTIGLPKLNKETNSYINQLVAVHEAGHTLVALLFNDIFTVRKVTINANTNGAGGYTLFTMKDRYLSFPTKKSMLAQLMVTLGGRAAETIYFNKIGRTESTKLNYDEDTLFGEFNNLEVTTGASNDLKQASNIARNYVNLFGADDDYCLSDNSPDQPFVGRELGMNNNKVSEITKSRVDKEVERIINYAYQQTLKIVDKNIEPLSQIANKLVEYNSINNTVLENIDISYS
jgi:cell division protease FtsH